MNGVSIKNSGPAERRINKAAAMVAQNGYLIAHPWKDAFAPSRKARKEMRLNESFRNQQIGLHCQPIKNERCS